MTRLGEMVLRLLSPRDDTRVPSDLAEDPQSVAQRKGFDLVLPADDELFIDIDDAGAHLAYLDGLEALSRNGVKVEEIKRTVSPGGNTHIYLRVPAEFGALTPETRIAFQAALGSDRVRELLSLLRILLVCDRPPTVFFEKKEDP